VHLSKDAISVGINKLLDSCTAEVVDAATDIDIQIKYLRQQPDLIAAAPIVLRALRNGPDVDPSSVNYESRKALLAGNAEYRQLSHYFKDLENSLGVDQIYLVDKWGTSVASSNWMSEGSSVGTNYKDRLNFIRGQSGFNTVQYSMGRTTHVPGLFFSTPLFQNKQFLGMLVVKLDLKNLLGFRGKTSTFLVDGNDVIVAAHDQRLNLTALSFDSIDLLTNSELNNLYLTDQLEKLNIDQWSKGEPLLTRFPGSSNPFVVASKSLNEYSLKVYEAKEFDAYYEISDKYQLFLSVQVLLVL